MRGDTSGGACSCCGGDTASRVIKDVVLWLAFALYVLSLVWLVAIYMGIEGIYCSDRGPAQYSVRVI